MADLAQQKAAARKLAFARRKPLHNSARGTAACENLRRFLQDFRDQPLSGYMAIRTEVDPLTVMAAHSQTAPVGVPIVQGAGEPLEFHIWAPDCEMQDGPFGARVPVMAKRMTPRVVILPLAAFDAAGHRLGYGGGFYDRTLERLRKSGPVTAVGFAYAGQGVEVLPTEATDQPMDALVTEEGIRTFQA